MTDNRPRYTSVNLGDETFKLIFNVNAFALLEDQYELYITDIKDLFSSSKGVTIMRTVHKLLYAAMLDQQPETDFNQLGTQIDGNNMNYLLERVGEALSRAFPEATEVKAEDEKKPQKKK